MKRTAVALALLCLPACKNESSSGAPPAASEPAPVPSASSQRKDGKPRIKETTDTSTDKLGSLPEGVGIAPGQSAPDASVTDLNGKTVALSSLWKKGPVLLVFYRGGWCPFCNFQVRGFAKASEDFTRRSITPVLISVDKPSEAAKTQATYEIGFPVLSDPPLAAHEAFHVLQKVDDETAARYQKMGIDLEVSSGKNHHTIAVPAMFLIDQNGMVRWAHADRDYKVRPSTAQVLTALDAAGFKEK